MKDSKEIRITWIRGDYEIYLIYISIQAPVDGSVGIHFANLMPPELIMLNEKNLLEV